ncbi:hypothetical protein BVJ53_02680 [Lacticaseibacillus chiayiensis]|uniref:Uncharacterized protein n=1 Tax=Lacticaseibacillus chiayiensis TaxID=2100821 RepID=A0A4Q1UCB9_9LACO|nr:hypothetical protein [Lacticaseibacillus chiayiensis]QVI33674.1 hypothetical protein KG086_07490 [Lacticaseibacillus chiayiensis]RXT29606.1 hypothetical protein BVJ53_02680 [Lacticaseibacillus chiayiensis]RXT59355.1 hypothetical protein CHT97_01110 [Lacticaseibacillus chiayiensis]UYN55417.1 hypothetical protein OFW50_07830 [Lacticaseibacillus chiayiensis]
MVIALWTSWLVLFFVTKVLAASLYFVVLLVYLRLPWRTPSQRGRWLIAHRGRGLLVLMGIVMLLTALAAYGIANWWFGKIEFQPQGVAVFGSVGIVLLSWLIGLPKKLRDFRYKMTIDLHHDNGDDNND